MSQMVFHLDNLQLSQRSGGSRLRQCPGTATVGLLVQKFGGTSVADSNKILAAARRAIRAHQAGEKVVVVVSARGHTTDELIDLAKEISDPPPARELDMLISTGEQVSVALMAMAVQALGVPAISFTGAQIGLVTDSFHTRARIREIATDRIRQALDSGQIVIVAGFQGIDANANITTLGRGGSDTTAVALAAVLQADACEIFTDVDGVYTTDPRVVPEARKLDRISYDEMLELASLGAGVMHSRSIEFAKKYGVPIHVRSSFSDSNGTWIVGADDARHAGSVTGCALVKDEARITVLGVPDRPGVVHELFRRIAQAKIVVDMIVQNVAFQGQTEVSFTVSAEDLPNALEVAQIAAQAIGAAGIDHDAHVSKVSIVGQGMRVHTGVAFSLFKALGEAGINIDMITTSEIKISVLVAKAAGVPALRIAHKSFGLEQPCTDPTHAHFKPRRLASPARGLVSSDEEAMTSPGMEDLVITDVELDMTQSRVTVQNLPNTPGQSAHVFELIANAGVFVDMIVQNTGRGTHTNLSFTVPRTEAEQAAAAVRQAVPQGQVVVDSDLAKLSVTGVGMRTHTGVATRMFGALADRNINIAMISTSEVRLNVITPHGAGQAGIACLRQAFHLPEPDSSTSRSAT